MGSSQHSDLSDHAIEYIQHNTSLNVALYQSQQYLSCPKISIFNKTAFLKGRFLFRIPYYVVPILHVPQGLAGNFTLLRQHQFLVTLGDFLLKISTPRKQSFICIYIICGSHAGNHDEYISFLFTIAIYYSLVQPLNTVYKMPVGAFNLTTAISQGDTVFCFSLHLKHHTQHICVADKINFSKQSKEKH